MEDGDGTGTSVNKKNDSEDLGRKETSRNKKIDSKDNFETEPSADKEDVSIDSSRLAPSVANYNHLGEDVGTASLEKNDNDLEEGDERGTSKEERSTLSLGLTASSNNTTNQIGKMVP
jgi:hypothetical protein